MKRKEKEEKRKTKINSGSTADRCAELKPLFDPSALKAQSNCGFVSEYHELKSRFPEKK